MKLVIKYLGLDLYLAYSEKKVTEECDGYFWADPETFKKCLPESKAPHCFTFSTRGVAKRCANMEGLTKYTLVRFNTIDKNSDTTGTVEDTV